MREGWIPATGDVTKGKVSPDLMAIRVKTYKDEMSG
jgi:hypothetical protein